MSDKLKAAVRPIERTPLTERVARQVAGLILEGDLQPGDKLPSEKELIEALGVSRPCVREALRGLAVLGLIEPRQGSGHFVGQRRPLEELSGQLRAVLPHETEVAAIQEARRAVEPVVVALAAQRATEADLARMAAVIAAYEAALGRGEDVFRLGIQVHQAFAAGCGNPALIELVRTLAGLARPVQRRVYHGAGVDRAEHDVQDHQAIYDAIRRQAPQDAMELMLEHLGNVDETLRRAMHVPALRGGA